MSGRDESHLYDSSVAMMFSLFVLSLHLNLVLEPVIFKCLKCREIEF